MSYKENSYLSILTDGDLLTRFSTRDNFIVAEKLEAQVTVSQVEGPRSFSTGHIENVLFLRVVVQSTSPSTVSVTIDRPSGSITLEVGRELVYVPNPSSVFDQVVISSSSPTPITVFLQLIGGTRL